MNRDMVDRMSALGIKDPTEDEVVNEDELRNECSNFRNACETFMKSYRQFSEYINGVEEDVENEIQGTRGVRSVIRSRNSFGARDIHDAYLEEDLNSLSEALSNFNLSMEEVLDNINMFL
jgi:hypothetical protein